MITNADIQQAIVQLGKLKEIYAITNNREKLKSITRLWDKFFQLCLLIQEKPTEYVNIAIHNNYHPLDKSMVFEKT